MSQKFSNNARSRLAGSLSAGATSFTIESATADLFPVANTADWLTPADWFKAVLQNDLGQTEIIYVGVRNAGSGLFSNVLRAQEGTAALAFSPGAVVGLRLTALDHEGLANIKSANNVFSGEQNYVGKLKQGGVEARMVPVGGIIMHAGTVAQIPAGWQLCDGTNGTPDLRNRFIIGASQDDAGAAKTTVTGAPTKSGGSKDAIVVAHNHTGNTGGQSNDHTHSGYTSSDGYHDHNVQVGNVGGRYTAAGADGAGASAGTVSSGNGSHTHTIATYGASANHTHGFTTDSTGASGANANLPPYYALAFICCMGYA